MGPLHIPPGWNGLLVAVFLGLLATGRSLPPGTLQTVVMSIAAVLGVVTGMAGLPPGAQSKRDTKLDLPDNKPGPGVGVILWPLFLAITAGGLLLITLPGCAHVQAGAGSLGKCEIAALPAELQTVVAKLIQVADEPADQALADMEAAVRGLLPEQVACVIAAAEAALRPLARSAAGDPPSARSLTNLETLRARHPRGRCASEGPNLNNLVKIAIECDEDGTHCKPYEGDWLLTWPCEKTLGGCGQPVNPPPTVGL